MAFLSNVSGDGKPIRTATKSGRFLPVRSRRVSALLEMTSKINKSPRMLAQKASALAHRSGEVRGTATGHQYVTAFRRKSLLVVTADLTTTQTRMTSPEPNFYRHCSFAEALGASDLRLRFSGTKESFCNVSQNLLQALNPIRVTRRGL